MLILIKPSSSNVKFLPILATQATLTDFHGNEAKRNFKMADSKKQRLSKPKIFSQRFQGLVLGLVVFIEAKGIDVAQSILSCRCPT